VIVSASKKSSEHNTERTMLMSDGFTGAANILMSTSDPLGWPTSSVSILQICPHPEKHPLHAQGECACEKAGMSNNQRLVCVRT
jgi:hypothetical protein